MGSTSSAPAPRSVPANAVVRRAEARISVQQSTAEPYDEGASPGLTEIHIRETFSGDIEGESTVRALQAMGEDGSGCLVSLQRVRGGLDSRQGTFVLQGAERVEGKQIRASWSVVRGSGTGELSGLRGEGGFEGRFGEGSRGFLDYWFE